jgi:hypothetical protein
MKPSAIAKPLVWTRGKVTEQANVVSILLTMMAAATCYGWIEGTLYVYYPYGDKLEIANHFTWYHVIMLALFFVVAFSISSSRVLETGLRRWYLLGASLGSVAWGFWIEDIVYFATVLYNPDPAKRGVLNSTAWVNWGIGGNDALGFWTPNIYLLLCAGGFALFAVAFVISRKDLVFRMALVPKKVSKIHKILIGLGFLAVMEVVGVVARSLIDVQALMPVQIRIIAIFLTVTLPSILILILTDLAVRQVGESISVASSSER